MDLARFFQENPAVAVAFSGGVDSAYLLYAAVHAGVRVCGYYVKTPFQPRFELDDAIRLSRSLGADLRILEYDVLSLPEVAANPPERCYHCKMALFTQILRAARADGFPVVVDGTNASDELSDRPGMRALSELAVRSPLREAGLTKGEIRQLSRVAGLFTWDKPAYACLATRIPTGTVITREMLEKTQRAECSLAAMGFRDFRVRMLGTGAKLQVTRGQLPLAVEKAEEIKAALAEDYDSVLLDLEVRNEQ